MKCLERLLVASVLILCHGLANGVAVSFAVDESPDENDASLVAMREDLPNQAVITTARHHSPIMTVVARDRDNRDEPLVSREDVDSDGAAAIPLVTGGYGGGVPDVPFPTGGYGQPPAPPNGQPTVIFGSTFNTVESSTVYVYVTLSSNTPSPNPTPATLNPPPWSLNPGGPINPTLPCSEPMPMPPQAGVASTVTVPGVPDNPPLQLPPTSCPATVIVPAPTPSTKTVTPSIKTVPTVPCPLSPSTVTLPASTPTIKTVTVSSSKSTHVTVSTPGVDTVHLSHTTSPCTSTTTQHIPPSQTPAKPVIDQNRGSVQAGVNTHLLYSMAALATLGVFALQGGRGLRGV
ncbi:hypothetical protein F4778DRAFT_801050 [Xylariomycetidae sp. FL2044]|nr:hypothetical protein F4778DRAFT_801050 [Xylariomycetidae sp. FL2044]